MGILAKIGAAFVKIKGAVMATTATKVATVVVAATVVVGGTVGVVQAEVFASPEKKVENALASLMENEEGAFSALLGLDEFFRAMLKDGVEADFGLKLEDVPMDAIGLSGISIPNIGVDFTYRFDAKKQRTELMAGAKVADTTLLSAGIYADKEKAMATVPQLFEGYIGADYAESGFLEKLKGSELATMLGEQFEVVVEALSASREEIKDSEETIKLVTDYLVALKKSKDKLFDSMEAEKDGEATVLVNGDEVQCKVYKATFGPEEVEAFLTVLIDETTAFFTAYTEENIQSTDAEAVAQIRAELEALKNDAEEIKEDIKGEIDEITLEIYLKGKRLVMADFCLEFKEGILNLNALFGVEGSHYDNMHLTLSVIEEDGIPESLVELIHATENTEETFSTEWTVIAKEEEAFTFAFTYEKIEGDFRTAIILPTEDFEFAIEGVLTIPNKGKELAFELNDISFTEYGETVSLGFETDVSLKVFEGEIAEPEEMKWNVVTMGATEWNDITSEVTSNIYSLIMRLLFSN